MGERELELDLQRAHRRIIELHSELERMLLHARQLSEASRKRVMKSMGLLTRSFPRA